jgi:glucuronide carrier protein
MASSLRSQAIAAEECRLLHCQAFADLAAGRLVDLTRSRWGKFRPYLLFASLPLLLSSVALFSVPNFDSTTAKYIYAYVTYALLGFLYSLTNIRTAPWRPQ